MQAKLILLTFLLTYCSVLGQTRSVEGIAHGRTYNESFKKWRIVELCVYVDDAEALYVQVLGQLVPVRAHISYGDQNSLIQGLEKGLVWAKKAREEGVELTKPIVEIREAVDRDDIRKLTLTFFSTNGGKQTDVIMSVVDFERRLADADVYLNDEQVRELLALLKKVPETVKALKESQNKAADFK